MTRLLVLVTGTGRSGTSTMAGLLHHLGLEVPGPHLEANESNPKGFFESRWSRRFHSRLLAAAEVHLTDSRPDALARVAAEVDDDTRARLDEFLARHAGPEQIVVKDPRSIWAQELWAQAAVRAGREIRFVTMLRHPAEVVGSRATWYGDGQASQEDQRALAVLNLTRWVNNSLVAERGTRGAPRAFVRYADLVADWRAVATRLAADLGLTFSGDLAPGSVHPADEFVDPNLSRHAVTWEELAMPTDLQVLAQDVWDRQSGLADTHGHDDEGESALDVLRARYDAVLADAAAMSTEVANVRIRDQVRAEVAAHADSFRAEGVGASGGRDLVRELARRVRARVALHEAGDRSR